MERLTVCCVKTKPNYDYHWVNRLYLAVKRNLTIPHRFVCFTDYTGGLKCPAAGFPRFLDGSGWWAKLSLFRPGLFDGLVLYLDLDSLIVGNLDFVKEYTGSFALLRDFYRPHGYGSGAMLFRGDHSHIWTEWLRQKCPTEISTETWGDQAWMEKELPEADLLQDLWPGRFVSYKEDCQEGCPEGASVVCFHGEPKNHQFSDDHWVTRTWLGEKKAA